MNGCVVCSAPVRSQSINQSKASWSQDYFVRNSRFSTSDQNSTNKEDDNFRLADLHSACELRINLLFEAYGTRGFQHSIRTAAISKETTTYDWSISTRVRCPSELRICSSWRKEVGIFTFNQNSSNKETTTYDWPSGRVANGYMSLLLLESNSRSEGKGKTLRIENRREGRMVLPIFLSPRRILDILYSAQNGNQHKDAFAWIIYHDPCC